MRLDLEASLRSATPELVLARLRGLAVRFLDIDNERRVKVWLAVLFALVVLTQGWVHLGAVWVGRPYENWDEIVAYNNAQVVRGETLSRSTLPYGPLDTAMQWAANLCYQYVDPIGKKYPHIRYSNNAPPSLNDPLVVLSPKSWDGMSFDYFRGLDDHQPIFVSRQIHLVVAYVLLLALGLGTIAVMGPRAVFVLVPLLLLTVSPEMYFQATQSLPNAINGLLTFAVVLFAMIYGERQQLRDLLISAALLAVGLNFKTDFLIVGGAPALALCVVLMKRGWRFALQAALWAVAIGLIVTLITRPSLVIQPIMDLRIRYHSLLYISGFQATAGSGTVFPGWPRLLDNLDATLLWRGTGKVVALGALLSIIAVFALAVWKRTPHTLIIAVGASVAVVAWVVVMRSPGAASRHFINGIAAYLAMVGMGFAFLAQSGRRWRIITQAGAAVLTVIWGAHAITRANESLSAERSLKRCENFDCTHQRNLASLDAIALAKTPGFAGDVLVDQHSYTDLRLFRIHGIDAKYVNMENLESRLAALDASSKHVVVFTRGAYDSRLKYWSAAHWSAGLQRQYDGYQTRLLALPVARHYEGPRQALLSGAPVQPGDEIFVSVISAPLK